MPAHEGPRIQPKGGGERKWAGRTGPTLPTNTIPRPRARGRVTEIFVGGHNPTSAHEGPRNRPRGRGGGADPTDRSQGTVPANEHRPLSARARPRVIERKCGEGPGPWTAKACSIEPSGARPSPRARSRIADVFVGGRGALSPVRVDAAASPMYSLGRRNPMSAQEGPRNQPKGRGGTEPLDGSLGTKPAHEHHPVSARARPRSRAKMGGGTETMDRERELSRATRRRPIPLAGGRVTVIFVGGHNPTSAHEGPRNRPEGRGGTGPMDGSHGANPAYERRPVSARARPRNRAGMWGGTENEHGEREINRATNHRPNPRARGRVAEIFVLGAQSEVRARGAAEPTEGAREGGDGGHGQGARDLPRRRTPVPSPRARGRVIGRKGLGRDGESMGTGTEGPNEPSNAAQVRARAAASPRYPRVEHDPPSVRIRPRNRQPTAKGRASGDADAEPPTTPAGRPGGSHPGGSK